MLNSYYRELCSVELPFAGRQKYMHTFDLAAPVMAAGFEDYLELVMRLCEAAGARSGLAHMTVDEKIVPAGMAQRRPRPHVDGCFMPAAMRWGHPTPGWLHTCNNIPLTSTQRMPLIIAASAAGCRAWEGNFDAMPSDAGDLSHIEHLLGNGEVLPANVGFWLSPDCVHESMIFDKPTRRTFLRIALPSEVRSDG